MFDTKTDSVTFKTKKTVDQCANALRAVAQKLRVSSMERIDDDPLGGLGSSQADIGVVLSAKLTMKDAFGSFGGGIKDYWAVQVYVYDMGNERNVELVALGDAVSTAIFAQNNAVIDFKTSKKKRDIIAEALA